jgi:hypothetical protein
MQLYQTQSSLSAAAAVLTIFTAKQFGNSRKAVAFVDGFNGKKCKTFSGTGRTNYDRCKTSYTFFCEFIDDGNILLQIFQTLFCLKNVFVEISDYSQTIYNYSSYSKAKLLKSYKKLNFYTPTFSELSGRY